MRIFISINISEELKAEVKRLQSKIQSCNGTRKIPEENMHLTIKFLGEVEDVPYIREKLRSICFKPFNITAKKVGFFPSSKQPNIVWIGFRESEELEEIFQKIETLLGKEFRQEFNFKPHLTIARIRKNNPKAEKCLAMLEKEDVAPAKSYISSFQLMKSTLTPTGPKYEPIEEFHAH